MFCSPIRTIFFFLGSCLVIQREEFMLQTNFFLFLFLITQKIHAIYTLNRLTHGEFQAVKQLFLLRLIVYFIFTQKFFICCTGISNVGYVVSDKNTKLFCLRNTKQANSIQEKKKLLLFFLFRSFVVVVAVVEVFTMLTSI